MRLRPSIFLVCILISVYLLVYVNTPTDADGQALLAVAETGLMHGHLDMNVMGYTEWLLTDSGSMGSFGTDGALYAKKGITPSLAIMPLVLIAKLAPWLSIRATTMLFNVLVTTATTLVLYHLARDLGYRVRTAMVLGLIYGLATFAITYVKTLFGEPLAALIVLSIVYLSIKGKYFAVTGALLGLLIGLNTIYALFVPLVALFLFLKKPVQLRNLLAFSAPIAISLALLGLYNWVRFGSPLTSGYHFAQGEGFTNPFFLGVFGLTFSPYRGLFWYNPVLLLSIPGWLMFRRIHARWAWFALALIALQVVAFASWWSWHGGVTWGPRFLLPALPLMVLFLAPLVESGRKWIWAVVGGMIGVSFVIQILGALYNYLVYEGYLFITFWPDLDTAVETLRRSPVLFDALLSPIIGHLALLRAGAPVEVAWAANGVDIIHLLAALSLMALGLLVGFIKRFGWLIAAVAIFLALNLVAARQPNDVRELENALQPSGVALAATTLFESGLMDVENGTRVISVNAPTAPDDDRARQMFDYARSQAVDRPFWYVTWFAPASLDDWQARELWQSAYFVAERPVGNHRALWFDLTPPIEPQQSGGWRFNQVAVLENYTIVPDPDGVRVVVAWSRRLSAVDNHAWFIHLVDANGQIVAQQDRQPQGGYAPTSQWEQGTTIIDRLFFPLPTNTDLADWHVRIGWVDPATGDLMPVFDNQDQPLAENFVLLPVR